MQGNYTRFVVVHCLVACALTAPLFGQQSSARTRPPLASQDSVVTQLVTTTLVAQLVGEIADAGLRDTASPWVIAVPPDSGALRWSQIARSLRRPLNARDRQPSDRAYFVVSVRSVLFTRDSLVLDYFIGAQHACGAKFTGGGTEFRAPLAWQPYPSPYTPIPSNELEISDSAICRSP
jgi:hypothetical protein